MESPNSDLRTPVEKSVHEIKKHLDNVYTEILDALTLANTSGSASDEVLMERLHNTLMQIYHIRRELEY